MKLITPQDLMDRECTEEFQTTNKSQEILNIVIFWIALGLIGITFINIIQMTVPFKITYSFIDPPITGLLAIIMLYISIRNIRLSRKLNTIICG